MNINSRTVSKSILIGLPALVFLACSGSVSTDEDKDSVGGSKDDKASSQEGKKGKADKKKKSGNSVGNWDILSKPQFKEQYGTFGEVKLKVRNNSDSEDEPWLSIRLTNKKGDLVTEYDCIGRTVEPGQTTTLSCTSLDDYAPWSDYEIQNAF